MKEVIVNTKPKIIRNNKIDTIDFVLIFPNDYVKEEMLTLEIIESYLTLKTKKYPSEKEFFKAVKSKMIIDKRISHFRQGNKLFIKFELSVPKEGLINDYSLENAFELFVDSIYNPLMDDEMFDEKTFELEKQYHINREIDDGKSIKNASFELFSKIIDPEEKIFISTDNAVKSYQNSKPKDAYSLYKKYVLDNDFISYVYGDISEKRVEELFNKYLNREYKEIKFVREYDHLIVNNEYEYLEDSLSFNQSTLFMAYGVNDFSDDDIEYLSLVGNILGASENNLIFKSLRIDNSIVYTSSVNRYALNGFFYIRANMQNKNKDLAIKLVKDTIEKLKDKDNLVEYINKLIRGMEIEILRTEDTKYCLLDDEIEKDLKMRSLKNILSSYKEMDIDDILNFIDRVYLNKVFFLRGENDEEN